MADLEPALTRALEWMYDRAPVRHFYMVKAALEENSSLRDEVERLRYEIMRLQALGPDEDRR